GSRPAPPARRPERDARRTKECLPSREAEACAGESLRRSSRTEIGLERRPKPVPLPRSHPPPGERQPRRPPGLRPSLKPAAGNERRSCLRSARAAFVFAHRRIAEERRVDDAPGLLHVVLPRETERLSHDGVPEQLFVGIALGAVLLVRRHKLHVSKGGLVAGFAHRRT